MDKIQQIFSKELPFEIMIPTLYIACANIFSNLYHYRKHYCIFWCFQPHHHWFVEMEQ